jgi:hypothetical protein
MGANQSTEQEHEKQGARAGEARTCYYKLLEVDKTATEEE